MLSIHQTHLHENPPLVILRGQFVVSQWLNRAFDAYVLADADLEGELAQAQSLVDTYLQCVADTSSTDTALPEGDPAHECIAQVDPELDVEWDAAAAGAA